MFDIELKMNKGEFSVEKDIYRISNDIVKGDITLNDIVRSSYSICSRVMDCWCWLLAERLIFRMQKVSRHD